MPVLERVGQFRIAEALLVEIGADAEDDPDGRGSGGAGGRGAGGVQEVDEDAPVRLVGAEGERLLELVHDHDRPVVRAGRAVRPGRDRLAHGPGDVRGVAARQRRVPCRFPLGIAGVGGDGGEIRDTADQLTQRIGTRDELEHRAGRVGGVGGGTVAGRSGGGVAGRSGAVVGGPVGSAGG